MSGAQMVVWTLPKRFGKTKGERVTVLVKRLRERQRGQLHEVQIEDATGGRVWVPADSIAARPV